MTAAEKREYRPVKGGFASFEEAKEMRVHCF
jgi:hypothetical protein